MNAKISEQKQDTSKASKYLPPKIFTNYYRGFNICQNSLILLLREVGV